MLYERGSGAERFADKVSKSNCLLCMFAAGVCREFSLSGGHLSRLKGIPGRTGNGKAKGAQ